MTSDAKKQKMSSTAYKFAGWMGLAPDSADGKMVWQEYEPKRWEESDVDIEISHCGICGSDLHMLRSGWGPTVYPCCVGHEIVGKAVKVGSCAEKGIKVGDRVGVGAQCKSCLRADCWECSSGEEHLCLNEKVNTYNSAYADGYVSKGGYADYWRGHSRFVFKIPDGISSADAAPMLCGGVTSYSPLRDNGCGPGKKVGIVGLGGLGHFGVLYAKALGADEIVVISRSDSKKDDALKLGATGFIATSADSDWENKHARTLDLIVSTVSSPSMPLEGYLSLLRNHGQFIQVGAPEDRMPAVSAFALIDKNAKVGGSAIGSPRMIEEMLELTLKKGVKPWIHTRSLQREANQTVKDMAEGRARYRYVLVHDGHAGGGTEVNGS